MHKNSNFVFPEEAWISVNILLPTKSIILVQNIQTYSEIVYLVGSTYLQSALTFFAPSHLNVFPSLLNQWM